MVLYADDTNVCGEVSEENHDLGLNNLETWMAANKLTMNQDKVKTIVVSSKEIKQLIKFRGVLKRENDLNF